jgi:hypothetical protein
MGIKTKKLIAIILLVCCAVTMAIAITFFSIYAATDNDTLRTPSFVLLIISNMLGLIGSVLRFPKKTE